MGHYEPPVKDTIIQTAATTPTEQLTSNPTMGTGHNEAYRNIGTAPQNHNNFPPRMTSRNGLFKNSPNSSRNRNTPTCFRCGEQGHTRHECKNRVYCTHCRSSEKACRKLTHNTPSPSNSHIPTGYHPTATPPPLTGNTPHKEHKLQTR